MIESVTIERLGGAGDGVAPGPLFVAGALPGERVAVERPGAGGGDRGALVAIEAASPDRTDPFCDYYGRCGGCVAQHMAPALYRGWKAGKVLEALRWANLDAMPEPLADAHGEGRRRATFHVREVAGRAAVGFMAARSHDLVEIAACPVTVPALHGAPAAIARLAGPLLRSSKPLDAVATATSSGLDIDLRGSGPLGEATRQRLIGIARDLDLARLSRHGEILIEARRPTVPAGAVALSPPPGGFLQATVEGDRILAEAVREACSGAKRVADLFAGSGPFALRLAERAEVHAVESDPAALAALDRAVRTVSGLRRVTTEARDLFRRPLLAPEIARFDAIVLDPPRAGAEAQVRQLTTGSCDRVVMVSCDPGTFSRDAAALVASGFRLERVLPVDQFKWSAHVELVGVFGRPAKRRARRR